MKTKEHVKEQLVRDFHKIYEGLAPAFGYETRKETREFDPESPNGRLMTAVCDEILTRFLLGIYDFDLDNAQAPPLTMAEDMFQQIKTQMQPILDNQLQLNKVAVVARLAGMLIPDHAYMDEDVADQALDLYNACAAAVKAEEVKA